MENNGVKNSESEISMSISIEEKVKQRIIECKKLGVHNLVRRFFNSYTLEGIKKIGILEFGIDKIEIVDIAVKNQKIEVTKHDGIIYCFTEIKEKVEKYSYCSGIDETVISFSVGSQIVFRSKWRRRYDMSSIEYDSTDYPEEILSYIPGAWTDDLLAMIDKKKKMDEEAYRIKAEQDRIKKASDDKVNFGL